MKKIATIAVAVGCAVVALLDFFLPAPEIDIAGSILAEGVIILAGFGLLLGILNLLVVHGQRIARAPSSRVPSLFLVVGLLGALAIGVLYPTSAAQAFLFDYVLSPLQASMTALLAFFAVSAAYRTFRLRNVDAILLTAVSLFMVLTQLPFGETLWPELGAIRDWILSVPVTAGTRGILLGVALGTVTTSLRVLLAVDRPYLGE